MRPRPSSNRYAPGRAGRAASSFGAMESIPPRLTRSGDCPCPSAGPDGSPRSRPRDSCRGEVEVEDPDLQIHQVQRDLAVDDTDSPSQRSGTRTSCEPFAAKDPAHDPDRLRPVPDGTPEVLE